MHNDVFRSRIVNFTTVKTGQLDTAHSNQDLLLLYVSERFRPGGDKLQGSNCATKEGKSVFW